MKIFLAQTGLPEELLKDFKENPLDFLYRQEDRTEYKVKSISYLIDEIQKLPRCNSDELYDLLSKEGKQRYNTILSQINYLGKDG